MSSSKPATVFSILATPTSIGGTYRKKKKRGTEDKRARAMGEARCLNAITFNDSISKPILPQTDVIAKYHANVVQHVVFPMHLQFQTFSESPDVQSLGLARLVQIILTRCAVVKLYFTFVFFSVNIEVASFATVQTSIQQY